MIKLVVSDLDGTLLDASKKVHAREQEALRRAAREGVGFCLASGRLPEEMRHFAAVAGLEAAVIAVNGAYVYTTAGELLHEAAFEQKLAREILEAAAGYRIGILACTGGLNLTPESNEIIDYVNKRLLTPMTERPDLAEALEAGLIPLCKYSFFGDMGELMRLKAAIAERFAGVAEWYVTDKDCLDVMPLGVTKGAGLTKLLAKLGLRPEQTLCIGDSFNDVSMFETTPHSFAMAESDPLLRKAARYTAHNVAEAVEWALQRNREEAE